jgi:hypothetical protein
MRGGMRSFTIFIEEYSEKTYPLIEAPVTGTATLWLASSGYYRQAMALLRDMIDLVLWAWKIRNDDNPRSHHNSAAGNQRLQWGYGIKKFLISFTAHWSNIIEPLFTITWQRLCTTNC